MEPQPLAAPLPAALRAPRDLAPLIDHTVLRPGATADEVARACDEALQYGFAGVCVREEHLALVVKLLGVKLLDVNALSVKLPGAQRLGGRGPRPIAVCDFPRGEGDAGARAEEARRLAGEGAAEVDVVYPLPLLRARDHGAALADLAGLVRAAGGAAVKVILETAALSDGEKAAACAVAAAAGATYVKTSTGFGPGGATTGDVALLRALVGDRLGVKASGGIRTAAEALAMACAGASRIGASGSVAIVTTTF